jgi:hypothetical protein
MTTIRWERDYTSALDRARSESKPLYVDFFNPG